VDNKRVLLPIAAAVVLIGAGASLAAGTPKHDVAPLKPGSTSLRRVQPVNPRVTLKLRRTAWHWQTVMGLRHSHSKAPLHSRRALSFWGRQARHMLAVAAHPPHRRGWLCIHRYEGRWQDGGDPYWGGLQMDRSFMRRYAARELLRRGWADHWTPLEQMWVAERAYRSGRGYYPWPNTARSCGLI
jgi:hypothetical protein